MQTRPNAYGGRLLAGPHKRWVHTRTDKNYPSNIACTESILPSKLARNLKAYLLGSIQALHN
jgi:hypothetical protein